MYLLAFKALYESNNYRFQSLIILKSVNLSPNQSLGYRLVHEKLPFITYADSVLVCMDIQIYQGFHEKGTHSYLCPQE